MARFLAVRQQACQRMRYTVSVIPQLAAAIHKVNLQQLLAPVPPPARRDQASLPAQLQENRTISLEELRKHTSADSCWVVYNGNVYDVTQFLAAHPGGAAAILFAAGTCRWEDARW